MSTRPRLVGLRLQTLAVIAGKACSGSPKASRLSGCTWNSMFAWFRPGSERVNAPSWLGAALIGPVRLQRILERDRRLAPPGRRDLVQRAAARHLVDAPDLQVVLQVAADRRQVRHHLDPVLPEQRPRPQPRELQELRAVHRPRAQHHPAPRRHPAPVDQLDPGAGEPLRPPLDAGAAPPPPRCGPRGSPAPAPARGRRWPRSTAAPPAGSPRNSRPPRCRRR